MELVGTRDLSFVDQKSGELIEGVQLHYICPDDKVVGQAAMTKFIRKGTALYEKAKQIPLGEFTIIYGRRDSVQDFIF